MLLKLTQSSSILSSCQEWQKKSQDHLINVDVFPMWKVQCADEGVDIFAFHTEGE